MDRCDTSLKYGYYGIEDQRRAGVPLQGFVIVDKTRGCWSVEFALPLAAMKNARFTGTWGFNVGRTRQSQPASGKDDGIKYTTWTPLSWGYQEARRHGTLTFEQPVAANAAPAPHRQDH